MGLKIGSLNISSIKVGSLGIDKIYQGTYVLYESTPPTPPTYNDTLVVYSGMTGDSTYTLNVEISYTNDITILQDGVQIYSNAVSQTTTESITLTRTADGNDTTFTFRCNSGTFYFTGKYFSLQGFNVKSITLGKNYGNYLTLWGNNNIDGLGDLYEINLTKNITSLGFGTYSPNKLKITVDNENTAYYDNDDYCLINKSTNELLRASNISTLKQGIVTIGESSLNAIMFREQTDTTTTIAIPNGVTLIKTGALNTTLAPSAPTQGMIIISSIEFPSSLTQIQSLAITSTGVKTFRFNHTASDIINLPTAGSSTGAFYNKTARNVTIYTDNQTIHDYAWATDNITPTFYHLDGTAWA